MREYQCYGWVVLSILPTTEWSEADFDEGIERVGSALSQFCSPSDGVEALLPDCDMFPRVAYFKGVMVDSIDPFLREMERIAGVFDGAFGELAVLDPGEDAWAPSRVKRYLLIEGRIRVEGPGT